jgi:hypothetical protein
MFSIRVIWNLHDRGVTEGIDLWFKSHSDRYVCFYKLSWSLSYCDSPFRVCFFAFNRLSETGTFTVLRNHFLLHCAFHSGAENPVSGNTPTLRPTPVVARSKTWVCGRSLARTGGSHSAHAWMLYLVSVLCCQVEVCGSEWSFVKRNLTECGVSESDHET